MGAGWGGGVQKQEEEQVRRGNCLCIHWAADEDGEVSINQIGSNLVKGN